MWRNLEVLAQQLVAPDANNNTTINTNANNDTSRNEEEDYVGNTGDTYEGDLEEEEEDGWGEEEGGDDDDNDDHEEEPPGRNPPAASAAANPYPPLPPQYPIEQQQQQHGDDDEGDGWNEEDDALLDDDDDRTPALIDEEEPYDNNNNNDTFHTARLHSTVPVDVPYTPTLATAAVAAEIEEDVADRHGGWEEEEDEDEGWNDNDNDLDDEEQEPTPPPQTTPALRGSGGGGGGLFSSLLQVVAPVQHQQPHGNNDINNGSDSEPVPIPAQPNSNSPLLPVVAAVAPVSSWKDLTTTATLVQNMEGRRPEAANGIESWPQQQQQRAATGDDNGQQQQQTAHTTTTTTNHNTHNKTQELAAELLSVAAERDLLTDLLRSNVATMQQLQDQMDRAALLEAEKLARQQQELTDFVTEAEFIKETLREVKVENGELRSSLEDLTFESDTLKADLKQATLENAAMLAAVEELNWTSSQQQTANELDAAGRQAELETENRELRLQLIEAEKAVQQSPDRLIFAPVESDNVSLQEKILSLHKQLEQALSNREPLAESERPVSDESQLTGQKISDLCVKVDELESLLAARDLQIQELEQREQLHNPSSFIKQQQGDYDAIVEQNAVLRTEVQDAESIMTNMQEQMQAMVRWQSQDHGSALQAIESEKSAIASDFSELQTQYSTLEDSFNAQLRTIETLRNDTDVERNEHAASLEALTLEHNNATLELCAARAEIVSLHSNIETFQLEFNEKSNQIAVIEQRITSENVMLQQKLEQHLQQIQDVPAFDSAERDSRDISDLIAKVNLLTAEKDSLIAQIRTEHATSTSDEKGVSSDAFDALQLEKDLLEDELQEIKDERENLKIQIEELQSRFGSKENDLAAISSQLQKSQAEFESLKLDFDNISADLMSKEMELDDLQELVREKDEFMLNCDMNTTFQKQIADLRDENEYLKSQEVKEKQLVESSTSVTTLEADRTLNPHIVDDLSCVEITSIPESTILTGPQKEAQNEIGNSLSASVDFLKNELELMTTKYQQTEEQRKQTKSHLAALGKSLKKAEIDLLSLQDQNLKLDESVVQMREAARVADETRVFALEEYRLLLARCKDLEMQLARAIADRENNEQGVLQEMDNVTSMLTKKCSHLESEVARYREMEEFASSELEKAETLAREQDDLFKERDTRQRSEIDRLQQKLNCNDDAGASHAHIVAVQTQEKCEYLSAENARLHDDLTAYAKALSDHEAYQKEQTAWYESEFLQLQNATNDVVTVNGDSVDNVVFANDVYTGEQLHNNQNESSLRGIEEELQRERALTKAITDERDSKSAEIEELLVQFGLIKQQIDASEEHTKLLEMEVNKLQTQDREATSDSNEGESQLLSLVAERDVLADRLKTLETNGNTFRRHNDTESMKAMQEKYESLEQDSALLISNLKAEARRLQDDITRNGDSDQEVEYRVRLLEGELQAMTKAADESKDKLTRSVKRVDELEKENENEIKSYVAEIADLNERILAIQEQLSVSENRLSEIMMLESGASVMKHIEEIDSLRSHVVSLALALERSENNRADSINRIVSERESHSQKLRSMSDNVKRFYATFNSVDA